MGCGGRVWGGVGSGGCGGGGEGKERRVHWVYTPLSVWVCKSTQQKISKGREKGESSGSVIGNSSGGSTAVVL